MTDLSARIAALPSEKRTLLVQRLIKKILDPFGSQILPQRGKSNILPLSFAQERLWFLDQLEPNSALYNIPVSVRLTGLLNLAALEQSLNEIIRRHEALRTTFPTVDGHPVQMVAPTLVVPVPMVDLREVPPPAREAEAQRLAIEEAQRPFDLAGGPLVRTTLLRLGEVEHVLLLTIHHMAFDGWSSGVLIREISILYDAFSNSRPSPLPELPIQYADYAIWQRTWLQREVLAAQLAYWTRQLEGAPALLEVPTDRPRPTVQSFRGARHARVLPRQLVEGLQALARREGVTLFMVLLAGFQTLLHRYTGQDDILVGTPVAGRGRPELEGLIGFFANTLVLRTDLSGDPPFQELLGRVREVCLGAYAHQELPFEQLVEALRPERSLSHTPLFQVVCVLQNTPLSALELPGLTADLLDPPSGIAKFDLILELTQWAEGLRAAIEYRTELLEAGTIGRLLGHLEALLAGIVAQPEGRLSELPLLTEAERHQLLVEWNATQQDYPRDRCIHELFETQVARTPEAIAVVFEDQRLTYGELNRRANQLAHHLRALGVGPETLVGVCLERSPELVVGLLGVLKAGGAYVPLEPSFPKARVHWILSSLKIACLLTQHAHLPILGELEPLPQLAHVVCLDASPLPAVAEEKNGQSPVSQQLWRLWTRAQLDWLPTADLPAQATSNDLAYIIFTSGSTGTPKGVMLRHQPIVNVIDWVNRTFGVGPTDRVLFVTSLCFDLSVYDIFGLLAAGGSVRVVADRDLHDPEQLVRLLCEESITFWDSAPAALQQLVPFFPAASLMGSGADTRQLRLVFLSGDWIPVTLPDQVRAMFPRAAVIALGGATEAAIWSNYYPVGVVEPQWTSIPYGKPIQNARYHILDAGLSPCPIGVVGNLYIGGECLASGYVNEPALTAEKFIPDPFGDVPGARLYKTGDLARYWADGTIEFLGRRDHQIKIRGFRVELGEIETVLGQHPAVREAVVLARQDTPGDKRLVAYVVADDPAATLSLSELRGYLKERLPEYMMPAAFVLLDALPLTPNGKVDRKALPAQDAARPDLGVIFVAPRTATEVQLAEIWVQLLGVERVGIHDNFFELGGHSLLATEAVSDMRQAFQVELPLRSLFESPTVAELSRVIERAKEAGSELRVSAIVPVSREAYRVKRSSLSRHSSTS
jgi:amino acid adenylation domain-containing protein